MNFCVKSKIFTKIIASAMSVMMIFSMSGVSVKAAQLQENNELKTVMVDMKDVATGDAIVYASTSTSTKTLSKDYATSTGQTGAITSIGQNVDFSSIIPQGSVIESITIYCPTGTRVTQSKYTTINNYLMDFSDESGGKRDGGTSYVIKNLKTFYFSKIRANFIAIFDNDAEGYSSKCSLLNEIKNWPENFRILLYPEITMFHKYPTIAPNGKIVPDEINKKAASIELYLPDSIIKTGGNYYPIEWESRKRIRNKNNVEEALYQGVISYKDDIKHKFHEMRNKIERGDEVFKTEEWKNMKKLLETIVFAFNNEQ